MNSHIGIPTKHGLFVATFSDTGLFRLEFPKKAIKGKTINRLNDYKKSWFNITTKALNKILLGKAPQPLPPLDLTKGTEFQRNVWQRLLKIPLGQTKSYGKLADELNKPRAFRAVGNACGANPIPIIIPCHRVLAAKYRIGGYSGECGWKQYLLKIEGAIFME